VDCFAKNWYLYLLARFLIDEKLGKEFYYAGTDLEGNFYVDVGKKALISLGSFALEFVLKKVLPCIIPVIAHTQVKVQLITDLQCDFHFLRKIKILRRHAFSNNLLNRIIHLQLLLERNMLVKLSKFLAVPKTWLDFEGFFVDY